MKLPLATLTVLICSGTPAPADPWKDESGHGTWRGDYRVHAHGREYAYAREHREESRHGHCEVEREWERDGDYKEEWKCDGDHDD